MTEVLPVTDQALAKFLIKPKSNEKKKIQITDDKKNLNKSNDFFSFLA